MQAVKKKSLIIFTCLFAGLLVIHTAFVFYHRSVVLEYTMQATGVVAGEETKSTLTTNDGESGETISERTVANSLDTMTILQILMGITGLPLLFFLALNISRSTKDLSLLARGIEESNRAFIFNGLDNVDSYDEAKVQTRLVNNLKKIREFIVAVSSGNYGVTWEGMTEANKDSNRETVAGALLHMRDKMEMVKKEDEIRIWTTEGLSKFGEIIRKNQNNVDKLAESLISTVVNYMGAKVGGLFILEEDENGGKHLQLRASYAYERKKYITKRIEIGEGIIGQCYLEAHTIHLAKVPNNYLSITSGLGGVNPNSLLVIPLKTNDKIEGVLELASLKEFKPHEIEFLEKLGELLASSIITVRSGEKTNQLLAISQEQAEEMRAQEEEMRQNMEELEATQEQMNRTVEELGALKENLEKEKYLLDSLMDNIPDAIYFKDRSSKFIRISKYLADHFGAKVEDLVGKSDFDFQDAVHAQEAHDDEMNIMKSRKPKVDYIEKEIKSDGSEHWVSTTKMPLVNQKGDVVGTFGISRDVTKLKRLEIEVLNKEKGLLDEKVQYEQTIKMLEAKLKEVANGK